MFQSITQFLFKFSELQFSEGTMTFDPGIGLFAAALLVIAVSAGVLFVIAITNIFPLNRIRVISGTLRLLAILLLLLPVLEPVLLTPDVIPDENFLVVLADKSASMSIEDGVFGGTRDEDVSTVLAGPGSGLLPELEENFIIRYYTFGDIPERVDSLGARAAEGNGTNIESALRRVVSDFKGLPLSGIVMLTDGADNSRDNPLNTAEELRSMNIPLHIVGIGGEEFAQERELLDAVTSKGLEEGTGAEIEVKVKSWIEETAPVTFNLYKGEEIVFSETRNLKGGGMIDHFTFFYEPKEKGAVEYSLKIDELPNEVNLQNNSMNILIDSRKDSIRVLYFEGHARSDFKFIKRALEDDQVVEFTSLLRTGQGKYYRQGIRDVHELVNGFPQTEEELYKFKAVIFGDLEASYFSLTQLDMIERFVRERGGGFLMLGGRNSFAEGDYWNTPIADILPVGLDPAGKQIIPDLFHNPNQSAEDQGFEFQPTRDGLDNPILKLAPDLGTNRALWREMPHLTSINYFDGIKPGATVLAVKPEDEFGEEKPLLAIQNYGRGRTAALGSSSTWRWQMMLEADDTRHERFWRQLVRWLITAAPNSVNIEVDNNVYAPDEEVEVRVSIYDEDYNPLDFADLGGTVVTPSGEEQNIVFHPDLVNEGEYTGIYVPQNEGVYSFSVRAERDGEYIGSSNKKILSRPSKKEFFNATKKRRYLQDLAAVSGGLYYDAGAAGSLIDNVKTRRTATSVFRSDYLWDMPFLYLLAFVLLIAEWIYRRRKGLP